MNWNTIDSFIRQRPRFSASPPSWARAWAVHIWLSFPFGGARRGILACCAGEGHRLVLFGFFEPVVAANSRLSTCPCEQVSAI